MPRPLRILCILPPQVPSYFNAGHHLPVFQVASHLRSQFPQAHVIGVDAAALNWTWKSVGDCLAQGWDIVAILNDFDSVDLFGRFVSYVRELSAARIITFGRLSKQVPTFFERFRVDAIAEAGDYEDSVASFVEAFTGLGEPRGVRTLTDLGSYRPGEPGRLLESSDWPMPNWEDIPYAAYDRLYADDLDKFCGIPLRREVVVPVARGCPIGCAFCDVPLMQGKAERRLTVSRAIEFVNSAKAAVGFDYVSFYAPTFTLRQSWVLELCDRIQSECSPFQWKCVTTTSHLNDDLLRQMARAGCVRVSVGVETLGRGAQGLLPPSKRDTRDRLLHLAGVCRSVGIELNAFVILGLPGDAADDSRETSAFLQSLGCRVRPTMYAPYHELRGDMTSDEVALYNRQLIPHRADRHELYDIFFSREEAQRTQVHHKIPESVLRSG